MIAKSAELIGLAFIPTFLILDLIVRREKFAPTRYWRLKGLVVSAVTFLINSATSACPSSN